MRHWQRKVIIEAVVSGVHYTKPPRQLLLLLEADKDILVSNVPAG